MNLPQNTLYQFEDTIRLISWEADSPTISSGAMPQFTLCWQITAPTNRPAAYSLKLVEDGIPVGERTTVHGLGHYDWQQWQTGYSWCEVLEIPVGDVEAGMTYDILLVLLDAQTGAVDWQATTADGTPVPFPVLGQVRGE
jgi:hypothetical protein